MSKNENKSNAISAGSEEITGSKILKGVYKKPTASVQIPKKITVNFEDDVTKIIFQTHFIYKEATPKKDTPHFTLVVKLNGKEVSRSTWSDPDVYNKFEEHEGFLQVEIDLKKFYLRGDEQLNFEIHLECYLEEQPWGGGAIKETASAYDFGNVIVNLGSYTPPVPEPEISLKVFPTHSPGDDKSGYVNTDWGEPYRLELNLNNKTDFTLKKPGSFELFENGVRYETATLGENLDSKQTVIVLTVKKAKTKATWEIQKDNSQENKNTPDYFEWYEDIGGGEFGIKKKNQIYKYYTIGYVEASNAGPWDLETEKISVNVRVPDYKIEAMNVHNKVKGVKDFSDFFNIIGALVSLVEGLKSAGKIAVAEELAKLAARLRVVFATILFFEITIGSYYISLEAANVMASMKIVMDDPPSYDKNYKKIIKLGLGRLPRHKNKIISNFLTFSYDLNSIGKILNACVITKNRYGSAKLKSDHLFSKKQFLRLITYKHMLKLKIKNISKTFLKFANLVSRTKLLKYSPKHIMYKLKIAGFTVRQIRTLEKLNKKIMSKKSRFEIALRNLSKSFKKFGDLYDT